MPRQVIVWECEHCKKKRNFSKTWIEKHEASCMANPNGKNCYRCIYINESGCSKLIGDRKYYTAQNCQYYEGEK